MLIKPTQNQITLEKVNRRKILLSYIKRPSNHDIFSDCKFQQYIAIENSKDCTDNDCTIFISLKITKLLLSYYLFFRIRYQKRIYIYKYISFTSCNISFDKKNNALSFQQISFLEDTIYITKFTILQYYVAMLPNICSMNRNINIGVYVVITIDLKSFLYSTVPQAFHISRVIINQFLIGTFLCWQVLFLSSLKFYSSCSK